MRERERGRGREEQERPRDGRDRGPDRNRDQDQERERGLDRERDRARILRQAARWREMEDKHPSWGHSFREHVEASDRMLERRAATGVNVRGEHRQVPAHASRWQSPAAMTVAAQRLWFSGERQRAQEQAMAGNRSRFSVRMPLERVLGPGWRDDVYARSAASGGTRQSGWTSDARAVAVWRKQEDGRWHLYTCYPEAAARHHGQAP